jgi:glycosyltransferase involved in cell wall biosynthesis
VLGARSVETVVTERDAPAIAVIMPVYNRARAVQRAINSVLTQEFSNFELIVVDDGSTDGTVEALEAMADPRLTIIRMPTNMGANTARNRGIEAASAPLLTFLDSDDAYLPQKLRVVVALFEQRPELDVLMDSFLRTYHPNPGRRDVEIRNPVIEDNAELVEALFDRRLWKATPGITVRREAALRAGGFDEGLRRRQDFDFLLRLAAVARCASTDQILWVKTYSAETISGDLRNFASATIDFYRRHPEYYANPSYRRGFSHDLGRHFARLLRRRDFAGAWRDARLFARELGTMRYLRLTIAGVVRFRRRRGRLREGRPAAQEGEAAGVR